MKKLVTWISLLSISCPANSIAASETVCTAHTLQANDRCYNQHCASGQELMFGLWFDPMAVKPGQMPLEFAEEAVQTDTTTNEREDFFFKPSFQFGFRLGSGFSSSCDNWSLQAEYIYWRNKSSSCVTTVGTGYEGTFLEPKIADTFGREIRLPNVGDTGTVQSTLKYSYNLLDVKAGWIGCACSGLEIIPYGGFRGLWYSTKVMECSFDSTGETFSAEGAPSQVTNDYSAYGVVGGIRLQNNLFKYFKFYGTFGGSLIGGNNNNIICMVANGTVNPQTIIEKENIFLFTHSLEGSFGVVYNTSVWGMNTHIGLGYEITQWNEVLPHPFRQNSTSPGSATKTSNGLFIQSIAVKLGVDF